MTRPIVHARDHWASGADPAATAWQVAGEGTNPDLEPPWTGTLRWRFDGNGDLELDGDIADGTSEDTVIFLPGAYWPAVTRTRPGWLTSEGALIGTTVSSADGEVTVSDVTGGVGGGGGGSVAAADVSIADAANDFTATNVESALAELQSDAETDVAALAAHLADTSDAHDASAISILDTANDFTATDVEGALAELQSDAETDAAALAAHLADTSAAHAASAISADSTTLVGTATDVQGVLEELDNAITAVGTPNADDIPFTPAGSISATDVQAAIEEVAAEAGSGGGGFAVIGLG